MTVEGWRLYYTSDRRFSSVSHDWADLPDDGVLVLRLYYDEFTDGGVRYTKTLSGDDYYFHVPGTDLFGCNNHPPKETEERYPGAIIKRGQWTTHDEMRAVQKKARHTGCPK